MRWSGSPASERGRPSSSCAIRSGASEPASSIVPTSVRTMCRRKPSAVIVKSSAVSLLLPVRREHGSHERVVPRLGQRERAEVVLAVEQQRGRLERTDVHGPRPQERPPRVERRPGRDDPVAVRPRASREARIEVLGRLHGLDDGHVLRQRRVQRLQHPLRAAGLPRPRRLRPAPSHAHRSRCARRPRAPPSEGNSTSSASRSTPSTVRRPGCRAQPRKPVPSYSSVSLRFTT